ncbi:MAG TPA: rhomboid family intramembrane serine protease, partial [Acidobacteria bacterium]|nr:rhomboid family intramembrane serine protease [Acidobacteriota bacterium]
MIIPIGQQDSTVRRLPWVTFTIMILCVLVFLGTLGPTRRLHRQASLKLAEAATYWMQHPYLKPDKRLKGLLTGGSGQREEAMMELVRQFGKKPPPTAPELKKQQAHLEELVEAAFSLVRKIPAYRWGLVPAHPTATTYITYMFMHGGWLHLLGNLFILFLTGPFLEDAWGRPLYAGVYLISGIFSAFMFAVHYPHFQGPLIGASGAIAGVMGAFLIRFWSRRIRFFYWFFFVFFGTFEAPAWLMLGLWLARELVFAQAKDTLAPGTGGGTAHWAHVWGFGFGLLVAFVVKRFDLEERFIHPAIESKITVVNNEPIERAMEAYKAGDVEQAWRLLEMELRKNPDNLDTQLALWNLAVESGRARDAVRHAKRLIRSSLRSGNEEGAVVVWSELMGNVPGTRLDPSTAVSVARVLADGGRLEEAERALEALTTLPTMEVPAGPLVRGARLAVEHRLPISRLIVARLM